MRTIALVNQKGGVGKSTTAVNLSAGLAKLGKRVLLIDLDPQAHATVALGLDPRKLEKTIYTLLSGQAQMGEVLRPVADGLSIIPSNIHLAGGEAELSTLPEPAYVLKRAMGAVNPSDFDYAIVDCPPQLGFLNVNCLIWVREVFIPMTCEFYALHGLSLIMDTVERLRAKLNPALGISGVITCQVHPRRAITRDVLSDLERHFPGKVLKTRIRVNVRLVEAPSHGKSIFDYAPDSNGAADYMSLAREIAEQTPSVDEVPETPVAESEPAAPVVTVDPAPVTIDAAPAVEAVAPPVDVAEPAPAVVETVEPSSPAAEAAFAGVEAEPLQARVEEPSYPILADPAPEVEPSQPASEPESSPYVQMEPGVPLTTPVVETPEAAAPAAPPMPGSSSTYAQMLGLSGLKPIVVAKAGGTPPPPAEKGKKPFGSRLLGKLMGKKD